MPINGNTLGSTCNSPLLYNKSCNYKCNKGYKLSTSTTCSNGVWTNGTCMYFRKYYLIIYHINHITFIDKN